MTPVSARIDPAADVFTLINTFHTSPDRQAAIVESLTRFTATARDLPGFVGTSVHASFDGARVVNYVQWQTQQHLEAMLARDDARAHMAEVGQLADRVEPIPYRVAFVAAAG